MKFCIRLALLSLCLLGFSHVSASIFSDRNFDQDHMILTNYSILILSPFEDSDHISAYSDYGNLLWDVSFSTKVISWKIKDGYLYAFSKSRYLEKTYLTCIDPASGLVVWERP
jgi:outer membrane protein assembly factor BamB